MKGLGIIAAALLAACPLAAQESRGWDLLGAGGEHGVQVPSLEDLFLDLSSVLERADPGRAEALRSRLEWTDRRIGGLERLLAQVRAGLAIDVPADLLSPIVPGADEARLERERREVEGLRARQQLASAGRGGASGSAQQEVSAAHASTFGLAMLFIDGELPVPPGTAAGSEDSVSRAADKGDLGRSLQKVGDCRGALNAFLAIEEKDRGPAIWYRMGQCCEELQRWKDAETYYGRVVELSGDHVWGRMARQRLDWGRRINAVGSEGKGGQ